MRILHLTLKKKWFDMIASGEKKEEYRDLKPYWINRLCWHEYHKKPELELIKDLANGRAIRKDFDVVQFKNGYSKNAPTITIQILGIHYGYPAKFEWYDGPIGRWYFVIELGEVLK